MKFVVIGIPGSDLAQDRRLLVEAVEPGVGAEPLPVELLARD